MWDTFCLGKRKERKENPCFFFLQNDYKIVLNTATPNLRPNPNLCNQCDP